MLGCVHAAQHSGTIRENRWVCTWVGDSEYVQTFHMVVITMLCECLTCNEYMCFSAAYASYIIFPGVFSLFEVNLWASFWFICMLCRLLADFSLHIAAPFTQSWSCMRANVPPVRFSWITHRVKRLRYGRNHSVRALLLNENWRREKNNNSWFCAYTNPGAHLPHGHTHRQCSHTFSLLLFYSVWANTVNLSASRLLALHIFRPQSERESACQTGLNKDQLTTINTPLTVSSDTAWVIQWRPQTNPQSQNLMESFLHENMSLNSVYLYSTYFLL